tara:strand:- start:14792 stop:15361 length:570 start_codon:yes stop_codon:yes gene_type:complete
MTIQHNTITGSDLHEPKGVAAAAANKVYVSNGSASGTWTTLSTSVTAFPKGRFFFYNTGSPYTMTYGGATQKLAPTTTASALASLVTEATSARLTYTGSPTTTVKLDFDAGVVQSTGSTKAITLAVHKNGSVITGSEIYLSTTTAENYNVSGSCLVSAATNDYFEVYAFNTGGSGNLVFNKLALTLTAT